MRHFLLIIFIFVIQISFACTCINVKPLSETEFNGYNLVIKGKIISIDSTDGAKKILISVEQVYKGTKNQSEVLIVTSLDNNSCGINPHTGETWLIYSLSMAQYNYYTDVCTKSKNLDIRKVGLEAKMLGAELKFLKKKKH